ncbi:hypothetical protein HPP92_000756 [Vanilla planifolia]|uniref:Uncharacterized protein n=1 Tax=Vanilla planifolia TaxID=51239 RepID=A0A835RX17_VANPL|nr:hypothetical protein HPP92_000756 [Vanilla planifolia]
MRNLAALLVFSFLHLSTFAFRDAPGDDSLWLSASSSISRSSDGEPEPPLGGKLPVPVPQYYNRGRLPPPHDGPISGSPAEPPVDEYTPPPLVVPVPLPPEKPLAIAEDSLPIDFYRGSAEPPAVTQRPPHHHSHPPHHSPPHHHHSPPHHHRRHPPHHSPHHPFPPPSYGETLAKPLDEEGEASTPAEAPNTGPTSPPSTGSPDLFPPPPFGELVTGETKGI